MILYWPGLSFNCRRKSIDAKLRLQLILLLVFLMTSELMNSLNSGFLADTGGALGLFLGLSLLQIFSWFGNVWSFLMRVWLTIQSHMIRKRKVFIGQSLALKAAEFLSTLKQNQQQWKQYLALRGMDVQLTQLRTA